MTTATPTRPISSEEDEADRTRLIALVELARTGDKDAFGLLYDHYQPSVYRFLYYRTRSATLAEDLTADTFFRALRSMNNFRWQGRDFGAWLMTIARNLTTDHFKAGRTRLEMTTEDMGLHDDVTEGPESAVLASLTNEVLLEALTELPTEQRECLIMRFLQGCQHRRDGRSLGRSDGAIKQLQLRGVRNLAKLMPEGMRERLTGRPPRNFRPHRVVWLVEGTDRRHERPSNPRKNAMTGLFSARRRAEEFDATDLASAHRAGRAGVRRLLAVVSRPASDPQAPSPRPEFVSDLRERLMAEADTALLPQAAPLRRSASCCPSGSRQRDRRAGHCASAAPALVGATTSVAVAAQTALPGRVALPGQARHREHPDRSGPDDTARGQALLANAARSARRGPRPRRERRAPAAPVDVIDTLDRLHRAGRRGLALLAAYDESGDEAVIAELASFTGSSIDAPLATWSRRARRRARRRSVAAGARWPTSTPRLASACPSCEGGVTSMPTCSLPAGRPSGPA